MQYISLVNAGGSWVSWTEIRGTLEMILQSMMGRLNFPLTIMTDTYQIMSDMEFNIHCAGLNGHRVPVHLLLGEACPPLKGAGRLQSLMGGGRIPPSASPVQIHVASRLSA